MDGPTITLSGSYGLEDVERAFIDHLVSFSPRPQRPQWLGGTRFAEALRDGRFTRALVERAKKEGAQGGNTDYTKVMAALYLVEAARHTLEEDRLPEPPVTEFDPKTGTFKVFRSPGVKVVEVEQ